MKGNQLHAKKDFIHRLWPWLICAIALLVFPVLGLILLILLLALLIYSHFFFNGKKFRSIRDSIQSYIEDCNALTQHIKALRSSYVNMRKTDYGEASFQNISRFNYKKKGIISAKYAPNIYDCSKTVCDNARKQPFKYICKYFNVKTDEETLEEFESILNDFSAAEEGKIMLSKVRNSIMDRISNDIPWGIKKLFPNKLEKELGFESFIFDELYFPTYSFRYISSGGNSGSQFDVVMDIAMLERFISYLADSVKFKKSVEGQRKLMTPKLRRFIIDRDNSTCQLCGNSSQQEPNLLLEVDHIIPVSKGGVTTEENLQTLCWKCNRSKGAKIA